jgi:hypothetical protein
VPSCPWPYANAGHWPGYVLDRQGRTKAVLASTGCPPGIDPAGEFPTGPATTLEPGELVLMLTDGIVEAASPEGEQFGLGRTLGIVRAHQREAPDAKGTCAPGYKAIKVCSGPWTLPPWPRASTGCGAGETDSFCVIGLVPLG